MKRPTPSAKPLLLLTVASALLGACNTTTASLDVQPAALVLSGAAGATLSAPLTFTVSGGASVRVTPGSAAAWLSVPSAPLTVVPGKLSSLSVTARCPDRPQTLSTTLRLAGARAALSRDVPVKLTCTEATDTTPDAFSFPSVEGAQSGQTVTSAEITLSGLNAPAPVQVQEATLLVNGQESASATVTNGQRLALRLRASPVSGGSAVGVLTVGGVSATFTVTTASAPSPATVTAVTPSGGPEGGGTVVTLTGSGLSGASAVRFGGAAGSALSVLDDGALRVTAPPGTGSVNITVTTPAGDTLLPNAFTYQPDVVPAPVVTALAPESGPEAGGTTVTLTGKHLSGASGVQFGAKTAADLKVNSDTELTVTAPAGSGNVTVTVSTPGGSVTLPNAYTYQKVPGTLSATPNTLDFTATGADQARPVMVTKENYSGSIEVTNTCGESVGVTPARAFGPIAQFSVTPLRASGNGGQPCALNFTDDAGGSASVNVTVTTTSVTITRK